jgi:DNA primase
VVEGYTDVIALHEAGIQEAVATNGVALGETHFEILKKFSGRAVLMFDADAAGAGATERGFDLHHRIGLEVLVAPLPPGRDPADLVREDGADAIKKVVESAQPLLEFKLENTIAKLALDTPEARSRAVREVVKVLGLHPDPIARHEYAFMVARRVGVEVETVQRALADEAGGLSTSGGNASARTADRRVPGHIKVEREALRLLLTQGSTSLPIAQEVDETNFTAPARREVYRAALEAAQKSLEAAEVATNLSPDARSLFTELTVGFEESNPRSQEEIREVFMRLKVFRLEREIKARRNTLQEVNPLVDAQRHDALFTELVGLEAERRDLLRSIEGAE